MKRTKANNAMAAITWPSRRGMHTKPELTNPMGGFERTPCMAVSQEVHKLSCKTRIRAVLTPNLKTVNNVAPCRMRYDFGQKYKVSSSEDSSLGGRP